MRGEHCVETYRLSVCLGDVRFEPDLKLVLDTGFLDSLMAKDDSHRNRTLLDMAADSVGLETRIGCYRSAVMWDG